MDCQGGRNYIVRPGGAGNVCEQFKHFNVVAHLFAFKNTAARHALRHNEFNLDTCLQCNCNVPLKRRYYDGDFPLCRMDWEKPNYGLKKPQAERDRLFEKFKDFSTKNKIEVAILSDYAKGVFDPDMATRLVWWCRDNGIKTIVDPKKNIFQWQHCTVFKPNLNEAANFLRLEPSQVVKKWKDCVLELQEKTAAESVIVTDGGNGVFGIDHTELFEYKPERPTEDVRSVVGAGDCFAAMLATSLAYGLPVQEAVRVAWEAGAVYVRKKHNEAIWPHELLGRVDPEGAKILRPEQVAKICRERGDKKVVFSNGCFDVMHRGHTSTLGFAKRQGDLLIVGLNSDDSVRRLKGDSRPINAIEDRLAVVAAMGCVDFATTFDSDTPEELITALKPDIVVKGGDYKPEEVVGYKTCKIVLAPTLPGLSSSKIIERLQCLRQE